MAELPNDLDFTGLTGPVDPTSAREAAEREHGIPARSSARGAGCLIGIILAVGLPATAIFALGAAGNVWLLVPAAACLIPTVWLCVRAAASATRDDAERPRYQARLARFAEANGLTLLPSAPAPAAEGMLFGRGAERRRLEGVVRWPDAALEVGEYHAIERGYRGIESPLRLDYAVIALGRTVPGMLLHDRRNIGSAGLVEMREPTRFRTADGSRFTLWAWRADTTEALAVVDQELVELLAGHRVDLEFGGDRCVLWSTRPFDKADPETWRWLLAVARLLRARTAPAG